MGKREVEGIDIIGGYGSVRYWKCEVEMSSRDNYCVDWTFWFTTAIDNGVRREVLIDNSNGLDADGGMRIRCSELFFDKLGQPISEEPLKISYSTLNQMFKHVKQIKKYFAEDAETNS